MTLYERELIERALRILDKPITVDEDDPPALQRIARKSQIELQMHFAKAALRRVLREDQGWREAG